MAITSVVAHDVAALGLLWDHGPDLFGQCPVHPLHRLQGVRGVDHYDPEKNQRSYKSKFIAVSSHKVYVYVFTFLLPNNSRKSSECD